MCKRLVSMEKPADCPPDQSTTFFHMMSALEFFKPPLTFDPVALVQVDLALGLRRVRTDRHEVPAGDGAVQLPPGS